MELLTNEILYLKLNFAVIKVHFIFHKINVQVKMIQLEEADKKCLAFIALNEFIIAVSTYFKQSYNNE